MTAARKQRQAFREQALKIMNNRAEAQARVRVARAKAAETKAKIKREEKVRAQRAKPTAERSEEDLLEDLLEEEEEEAELDPRIVARMQAQADVDWWKYLPKGPKDDDEDPPAVPSGQQFSSEELAAMLKVLEMEKKPKATEPKAAVKPAAVVSGPVSAQ